MGNLADFARRELTAAGLFDKDSDYEGMLGNSVMELVEKFSEQGHSGYSASRVLSIFQRVAASEPLSPLTGEVDEWDDISKMSGYTLYQNKRCSHVFKDDTDAYDIYGPTVTTDLQKRHVRITFPYMPSKTRSPED